MNFGIVKINDAKYVTANGLNGCVTDMRAENDFTTNMICTILCFVDSGSQYIHLQKNQLDVQFIFSIHCQTPLHVLDVSTAHHQEVESS